MSLRKSLKRLALPPDTWERHLLISELAGPTRTVLDVGGVTGQLSLFMPAADITTLNVGNEDADVHFDGLTIPYPDDSFELAVSLDVLEHIDRPDRSRHIEELARVASRQLILCCPLGTPEHIEAEHELSEWYRDTISSDHRFLSEHLEKGLPTEGELTEMAATAGLAPELSFHGDFRSLNRAFQLGTLAKHRPTPRSLAAYARTRFNPRRTRTLQRQSTPWSNRVFVVADLT
jgi:hypothetical protein